MRHKLRSSHASADGDPVLSPGGRRPGTARPQPGDRPGGTGPSRRGRHHRGGRSGRYVSRRRPPCPSHQDDCPTSAQLYSDPVRPHAMPIVDPGFRRAIGELLGSGKFDVLHAHDWSISSAIGPAHRAGVPLVLTQHDYSHVCATKRMMRGDAVCPGPTPTACLRCASSWHGPLVGPVVTLANALGRRTRTRHVDAFIPVSSVVAVSTRAAPTESPIRSSPTSSPTISSSTWPLPHPDGPIVFVGDLSRDKGIEVLIEAHRSTRRSSPTSYWPGGCSRTRRSIFRIRWSCVDCSITPRSSTSCRRPVWSSFRRSCPTAVQRSSSRQWRSGGQLSLPQVEGSSTWWTTAPRGSWWHLATPSPCPLRSRR